jgi:hypothetical protein
VVKPLAGQTEQTCHSLACAVKTEGKIVCVWGPLGCIDKSFWVVRVSVVTQECQSLAIGQIIIPYLGVWGAGNKWN